MASALDDDDGSVVVVAVADFKGPSFLASDCVSVFFKKKKVSATTFVHQDNAAERCHLPCRGGDAFLLDCLGDLDSPRPAAPVDNPMMSIKILRRLAAAAVLAFAEKD